METLYPSYETPIYRSIPDLLETDPGHLSFREKHRVRYNLLLRHHNNNILISSTSCYNSSTHNLAP